jgi:hypothetical protein
VRIELLKALANLHASGALTGNEFEQQKRQNTEDSRCFAPTRRRTLPTSGPNAINTTAHPPGVHGRGRSTRSAISITRLGGLAVGLSVGAAMAATAATAAADPLPPFDPSNLAISIDGMTLFQEGTATATSGMGDIAIADGANSFATATGGLFDYASAEGPNSDAFVSTGSFDTATADA